LGMGYLITRYTRIFAAVLHELKKYGTRIACLCSGTVAQEKDGPLIYGNKKYAGFSAASFDHVALERIILDMMFGTDSQGFRGYITDAQKKQMEKFGIVDPGIIKDATNLWTLQMLKDLIGGELEPDRMNLTLLDYRNSNNSKDSENDCEVPEPNEIFKLRRGKPFTPSIAFYVSPTTWLRALHTDDKLAMNAFVADKKSIEVPLIPGVTK